MIYKYVFVFLTTLFPTFLQADNVNLKLQISSVRVLPTGNVYVYSVDSVGLNCTDNNKLMKLYVGHNDIVDDALDRFLSLLLLAVTTKSTIDVWLDSSTPNCYIRSVQINK